MGTRTSILAGCAVRVACYLAPAFAADVPAFLLGAVVTGLGGALFSPALELLVARADALARFGRPASKPSLFAALVLVGEVGAALGPLVGAAFFGWGFTADVLLGAGLFAVVGVALFVLLAADRAIRPRPPAPEHPAPRARPAAHARPGAWACLRHPRFPGFAAVVSVNLLAFNQLYLGLPLVVERSGAPSTLHAGLFPLLSLPTIALPWPLARLAKRCGARRALPTGFTAMAAGFGLLAWAAGGSAPPEPPLVPLAAFVACLAVGHILVVPVAMDLVPAFAGPDGWGSYHGLLATAGGVAALAGNTALGSLWDATGPSAAPDALPSGSSWPPSPSRPPRRFPSSSRNRPVRRHLPAQPRPSPVHHASTESTP